MPHRPRAKRTRSEPAHVTAKLRSDLPKLRVRAALRVLWSCMRKGRDRFGFRLCWFSIQRDHVHLLVEAEDLRALARGMQGLSVRFAKNLNKLWGRKGKVFADRYHDRPLTTPQEVRRALCYVLNNALHHGHRFVRGGRPAPDPYSGGPWFEGFSPPPERLPPMPPPLVPARTWLLAVGWLRGGGRIGIDEVPGLRRRRSGTHAAPPTPTPFAIHLLSADLAAFPD